MWECRNCNSTLEFARRSISATVNGTADYVLPDDKNEIPFEGDGDIDTEMLSDQFHERVSDEDFTHQEWLCPQCDSSAYEWADLVRWVSGDDEVPARDSTPAEDLTPAQIEQRNRLREKGLI